MTLALCIDTRRWREHHRETLRRFPGLVPVCKGNGYGFGLPRLLREAEALGPGLLAVGTAFEAAVAQDAYAGDLWVLTPWREGEAETEAPLSDRVVRTVSSLDGVRARAGGRVVVKLMSSMRRHGLAEADLPELRALLRGRECAGFSVHLPLSRPNGESGADEVTAWMRRLRAARLPLDTLFVSHLSEDELALLRERFPGTAFRPRMGTRLWLGDPGATGYRSRVLGVRRVTKGERYGTRQRRASAEGYLVVVSGGASHGIGLSAPRVLSGLRPRARQLAGARFTAVNRYLSPFLWDGRRCRFAEPPDLLESVLWVPADGTAPAAGARLPALVRYTITRPDHVVDEPEAAEAGVPGG